MNRKIHMMTRAAVIAAAYVVLTLPMAQFAFGIIQFRLAEALTVLAALTPAALPGLFLGCLLANLLNPQNLGPIDVLGGSLATLGAAWTTWQLRKRIRKPVEPPAGSKISGILKKIWIISPPVWINALIVGTYLPFIIPGQAVNPGLVAASILSIFVSEAVVVYLVGLPLLLGLEKAKPAFLGWRS